MIYLTSLVKAEITTYIGNKNYTEKILVIKRILNIHFFEIAISRGQTSAILPKPVLGSWDQWGSIPGVDFFPTSQFGICPYLITVDTCVHASVIKWWRHL